MFVHFVLFFSSFLCWANLLSAVPCYQSIYLALHFFYYLLFSPSFFLHSCLSVSIPVHPFQRRLFFLCISPPYSCLSLLLLLSPTSYLLFTSFTFASISINISLRFPIFRFCVYPFQYLYVPFFLSSLLFYFCHSRLCPSISTTSITFPFHTVSFNHFN